MEYIGNLKITNEASIKDTGAFGKRVDMDIPDWADAVIICYNEGGGLRPFDLCLPHQIYVHKLERKLKQLAVPIKITVIPIRSDDYINIAKR
ncbi:MAG: hypothetical protein ACOC4Y_01435 [bacterium]